MGSLSVSLATGYHHLRPEIYEVEEHIREADPLNGERVPEDAEKVALMYILFEDLWLHVRRQGMPTDKHTYKELRALLREQASIKDDETVAREASR